MNRRDIIKYTAIATGAALSTPLLLSLESCKSESVNKSVTEALHFFDEGQMRFLTSVVDTILPKTDSPSASEVGVPSMIDQMVGSVYKPEDQKKYRANFAKLFGYLTKESKGKGFHKLEITEQTEILTSLQNSNIPVFEDAKNSLLAIKQQSIAYYLNTEEVATKFLNYLPVPGPYEGCISLDSVGGKAWAI